MQILVIGGEDFTPRLKESGIKWSRNDLDHSSSGRTLDGVMHRRRTAVKAKLSISLRRLSDAEMRQVNAALLPETIQVTYNDPIDGTVTKTFYGAKVSATVLTVIDGQIYWDETQFDLTEV